MGLVDLIGIEPMPDRHLLCPHKKPLWSMNVKILAAVLFAWFCGNLFLDLRTDDLFDAFSITCKTTVVPCVLVSVVGFGPSGRFCLEI
jgi:hypothetical protein